MEPRIFKHMYPHFHDSDLVIGFAQDNEHDHGGAMKEMKSTKKVFVDVNHNFRHVKSFLVGSLTENLKNLLPRLLKWMNFLLRATEYPEEAKSDMWMNCIEHLFGNHEHCIHNQETEYPPVITPEEAEQLRPIMEEARKYINLSHPLVNTQLNESINSLRAKLAPKCYSWKKSWVLRTMLTIIAWNEGTAGFLQLCDELGIEVDQKIMKYMEELEEDAIKLRDKSMTEEARRKRTEQRAATNKALRKPAKAPNTPVTSSLRVTDNRSASAPRNQNPRERCSSDETPEEMDFGTTTSTDESSDVPIAKEAGNYVDDSVVDALFATIMASDTGFHNEQLALGYTGIMNISQTCYFNSSMQIIAAAYRSRVESKLLSIDQFRHEYGIDERTDEWGNQLMETLRILIERSSSVISINDLVSMIADTIANRDFGFGEQCDPVFLLQYLTEDFDKQMHPEFPDPMFAPFDFHFEMRTYVDESEVLVTEPLEPIDVLKLRRVNTENPCYLLQLCVDDEESDVQTLIERDMNCTMETTWGNTVYHRRYVTNKSHHILLGINRTCWSNDGEAGINITPIEINREILIRGGDFDDEDMPGGVLLYKFRGAMCHIGSVSFGHFITYVQEDDRIIKLDDVAVSVANEEDLDNIRRAGVILLYEYESSVSREELSSDIDIVNELMIKRSKFLCQEDFIDRHVANTNDKERD